MSPEKVQMQLFGKEISLKMPVKLLKSTCDWIYFSLKLLNEGIQLLNLNLKVLNPFDVNVPSLYPLKTSEKLCFSQGV